LQKALTQEEVQQTAMNGSGARVFPRNVNVGVVSGSKGSVPYAEPSFQHRSHHVGEL